MDSKSNEPSFRRDSSEDIIPAPIPQQTALSSAAPDSTAPPDTPVHDRHSQVTPEPHHRSPSPEPSSSPSTHKFDPSCALLPEMESDELPHFHKGAQIAMENVLVDYLRNTKMGFLEVVQGLEDKQPIIGTKEDDWERRCVLDGGCWVYAAVRELWGQMKDEDAEEEKGEKENLVWGDEAGGEEAEVEQSDLADEMVLGGEDAALVHHNVENTGVDAGGGGGGEGRERDAAEAQAVMYLVRVLGRWTESQIEDALEAA